MLSLLAGAAIWGFKTFSYYYNILNEPPKEAAKSTLASSITDEEITKLLDGSLTLSELESGASSEAGASTEAQSEAASSEAESEAASEEASSSEAESEAESESSSPAATEAPASSAASSQSSAAQSAVPESSSAQSEAEPTATPAPAYEQEVKALLQELYDLSDQANKELNACVNSAWLEYMALPEEERTPDKKLAKKLQICLAKTGELNELQAYYDGEVDRILTEMRQILTENGQSTELADQAEASYEKQKSERYAAFMYKLYN